MAQVIRPETGSKAPKEEKVGEFHENEKQDKSTVSESASGLVREDSAKAR